MPRARFDRSAWMFGVVVFSLASAAWGVDPDPSGLNKSKFISFNPNQQESLTSIRIWMVSLHHVTPPYSGGGSSAPFTTFEGESVWVGPPATYIESTANPVPFRASKTQCTPYYHDWSTVGLLHVTGAHIVPSSIYEVEQLSAKCQGQEETCTGVSPRLEIRTTRWSDVTEPFNPPDQTFQPNISDCTAMVAKFRSALGAPIKARVFLAANNAFGEFSTATLTNDMSFSHIAAMIDAFRGGAYLYKMGKCAISRCSNNTSIICATNANCSAPGICATVLCANNEECGASGPCNLYCP
jgi:hypothetical protein